VTGADHVSPVPKRTGFGTQTFQKPALWNKNRFRSGCAAFDCFPPLNDVYFAAGIEGQKARAFRSIIPVADNCDSTGHQRRFRES
jgi:hypothetical protein